MSWKWIQTAQLSTTEHIYPQHGGEVWLTSRGWLDGDFLAYDSTSALLRWYCKAGQRVQRSYSFSQAPKAAIFAVLSMSSQRRPCAHGTETDTEEVHEDSDSNQKLAVVVLGADNVLWIYFDSGEHFDMKLHGFQGRLLSSPFGILLQSQEVLYAFEQDVVFPQTPHHNHLDTSNLSAASPFLKQFSDQSIDMTKGKSSLGYRFFSISSPFSPLRVISIPSSSADLSTFELLGIYQHWVFLFSPASGAVKVFLLNASAHLLSADDSHIISFTEEERRKSVEMSMNQSSFLDHSMLSNNSLNKSNQSGSSGRQSNASNNSSKMSLGAGSLGQTVRKQKPRPLPSPTMFSNVTGGTGRASPAVGQYDNDTLQQLLGLKSATTSNTLRHGGFKRSLSQANNPSMTGPRSFSPTVMRRASSGSEDRFTPLVIPDELEVALEQLVIDTLHNEVYFHLDEEMQWMEKACIACGHSDANAVFTIQFSHFTSKPDAFLAHILQTSPSSTSSYVKLICSADRNVSTELLQRDIQQAREVQLTLQVVAGSTLASLACVELSLHSSTQTLSTTKVPLFLTQQSSNAGKAFACFVGDCKVQDGLQQLAVEDDEAWLQDVLGLSSGESKAKEGRDGNVQLQHVNSCSPFLAIHTTTGLQILELQLQCATISGDAELARQQVFQELLTNIHVLLQSQSIGLESLLPFWMAMLDVVGQDLSRILCFMFAAVIGADFDGIVQFLALTTSSAAQGRILRELCRQLHDEVSKLPPASIAVSVEQQLLSFVVVSWQEYQLSNTSHSMRKAVVLEEALHKVVIMLQHAHHATAHQLAGIAQQLLVQPVDGVTFFHSLTQTSALHPLLVFVLQLRQSAEVFPTFSLLYHFTQDLRFTSPEQSAEGLAKHVVQTFMAVVQRLAGTAATNGAKTNLSDDVYSKYYRSLPAALRHTMQQTMQTCKFDAEATWPLSILQLVGRNDFVANVTHSHQVAALTGSSSSTAQETGKEKPNSANHDAQQEDGLRAIIADSQLRFPDDERLHEVCRMLQSSKPMYLKVERGPEMSETEFRLKQQSRLLVLCRRNLACTVGRGLLSIASVEPLMAEALPIPHLSLQGRVPPNNSLVALDISGSSADLTLWAEFHNGVAASLRIGPSLQHRLHHDHPGTSQRRITRNWILYNKTASLLRPQGEHGHAGFLLGLGLFGHLQVLSITDICDYLTQGFDATTFAILIGVAASKIGTADALFSKTLCLHLPSLLPAQHWDIEISASIQISALVGLGFLYCQSANRLIIQFLMEEMLRKPTSDRCESRESIALACSWALGMVLLPKHGHSQGVAEQQDVLKGLVDLQIEDRLSLLISGGKRPTSSSLFPFQDNYSAQDMSSKSSCVLEGDQINVDVTAPGAMLTLAMMYLRSNDSKVLRRLAIPTTAVELDAIRPDLLLFRAIAQSLIRWDDVVPTAAWIEAQIPPTLQQALTRLTEQQQGVQMDKKKYVGPYGDARRSEHQLSASVAFSLHLNIVSGFCMGIGIVYAGTFHAEAKATLLQHLQYLQRIRDNKLKPKLPFPLDKIHRTMVEMCICTVSLALACVMAGSGDLDCLRIFRELRWKVDDVTYGTHMALGMALGMLFLAGGKFSLRRDPISTACLLLAIVPRFPSRTIDPQYHLQALRHLYAMAVEPRVLHTIDVDTGLPVSVDLELELTNGQNVIAKAPGLLPELTSVAKIRLAKSVITPSANQKQYYPCCIDLQQQVQQRMKQASNRGMKQNLMLLPPMYVKQVPAISLQRSLSGEDKLDKQYFRNLLSQAVIKKQASATQTRTADMDATYAQYLLHHPMLRRILLHVLSAEL